MRRVSFTLRFVLCCYVCNANWLIGLSEHRNKSIFDVNRWIGDSLAISTHQPTDTHMLSPSLAHTLALSFSLSLALSLFLSLSPCPFFLSGFPFSCLFLSLANVPFGQLSGLPIVGRCLCDYSVLELHSSEREEAYERGVMESLFLLLPRPPDGRFLFFCHRLAVCGESLSPESAQLLTFTAHRQGWGVTPRHSTLVGIQITTKKLIYEFMSAI